MTDPDKKEAFRAIFRASIITAQLRPDLCDPEDTRDRLIRMHPGDEELILQGWEEVKG